MTSRRVWRDTEQRPVDIIEVNPPDRRLIGEDDYGTIIHISMTFIDPVVSIPLVGERWMLRRQGIDWYLHTKIDGKGTRWPLDRLQQGDRRVEASTSGAPGGTDGTVYINGRNVDIRSKATGGINISGTGIIIRSMGTDVGGGEYVRIESPKEVYIQGIPFSAIKEAIEALTGKELKRESEGRIPNLTHPME